MNQNEAQITDKYKLTIHNKDSYYGCYDNSAYWDLEYICNTIEDCIKQCWEDYEMNDNLIFYNDSHEDYKKRRYNELRRIELHRKQYEEMQQQKQKEEYERLKKIYED